MSSEATRLLQSMAAHSMDRSPQEFLAHAARLLSNALQTGNAQVSAQGTADLLLSAYRVDTHGLPLTGARGPGRLQQRRAEADSAPDFGAIVHAAYRSARVGVRHGGAAA